MVPSGISYLLSFPSSLAVYHAWRNCALWSSPTLPLSLAPLSILKWSAILPHSLYLLCLVWVDLQLSVPKFAWDHLYLQMVKFLRGVQLIQYRMPRCQQGKSSLQKYPSKFQELCILRFRSWCMFFKFCSVRWAFWQSQNLWFWCDLAYRSSRCLALGPCK